MATKIQIFSTVYARNRNQKKNVECPSYFYALEMMGGLYANSFDNFIINKIDEQRHTYKCKCMSKEKRAAKKKKGNKVCVLSNNVFSQI